MKTAAEGTVAPTEANLNALQKFQAEFCMHSIDDRETVLSPQSSETPNRQLHGGSNLEARPANM